MSTLHISCSNHAKKVDVFIEEHAIKKKEKDGWLHFELTEEDSKKFKRQTDEVDSYSLALRNVPITFFVALVSHYDAYLSNLIKTIFYLKPEILNTCQRQLTFSELIEFSSIDAARDYVIEKEVESILRNSHAEQFDWMEKRFNISLRKDLPIWPFFVELTERRNLFVHCDGIVSAQYLSVCEKHGVKLNDEIEVGHMLHVDPKYFTDAYKCLFEIGVKLGHVLWRKLCPDEIEGADKHLNEICFALLSEEIYDLAKTLLRFATNTLKKHASDVDRRVFIINYAIALKHLKDDGYKKLLEKEDWSACTPVFQMAVAVLNDRFTDAAGLMKVIGRSGKPTEEEYKTWPLFKEFRLTNEFKKTFRQVFKKTYMVEETTEKPTKKCDLTTEEKVMDLGKLKEERERKER
jgi:hypothetical protein